jgi:hypothetical protein
MLNQPDMKVTIFPKDMASLPALSPVSLILKKSGKCTDLPYTFHKIGTRARRELHSRGKSGGR